MSTTNTRVLAVRKDGQYEKTGSKTIVIGGVGLGLGFLIARFVAHSVIVNLQNMQGVEDGIMDAIPSDEYLGVQLCDRERVGVRP